MKEDFLNFDPVTVGAIITGLGNTTVGLYDAKKRREIDEFLAKQNAATQRRIAEDFAKAKTEQDKIRFIQELEKKQRRQKYMPYYIAGGILAVGVTIAVVLILRKKK
jgi:hypothetical protein